MVIELMLIIVLCSGASIIFMYNIFYGTKRSYWVMIPFFLFWAYLGLITDYNIFSIIGIISTIVSEFLGISVYYRRYRTEFYKSVFPSDETTNDEEFSDEFYNEEEIIRRLGAD